MDRRVVLAANSAWNIVHFRAGLIRALRDAGYEPVVVAPNDPECERRMEALQVQHRHIAIDRSGLNPFADATLLARYRQTLAALSPAAFLGFTIKPNIYGSIAARMLGIPVVANISGLGTAFLGGALLTRLVTRLYRFALQRADRVFFQNPDDRNDFVGRGMVRPEQAEVIPGSGIDLECFRPGPLPDGPPVYLLIARLLGDKGVREFVDAARIVRRDCPQARFQLLGPLDEGNRTAIRSAELEGWIAEGAVEYLGTTDDVRPAIAAATAIVLPSYREGVPRTLLEGAAMARPLIATDVPGCREVIIDRVSGLQCKAKDAGSLADAMGRFAAMTPDQREAMGEASRALVEERFGEARVIEAYLEALASIVRRA